MLENPYAGLDGGQWLRGNLHTHTTRSDGQRSPQVVLDDYAARGYDFLMLSDHDRFTTPAELAELNARGMVLLPGNEITANGPHMLHVNPDRLLTPHAQRQRVLNDAAGGGTRQDFIIVCHPNWFASFNHCRIEQMTEWTGYAGMEIFNGTIGRLEGSPYATNKWDMLLGQRRRVWGFANDDSHLVSGDTGLGWNMVYARERSVTGIVEALRAGRFYASTGVTITDIQVDGRHIRVETRDAERIVALQQVACRIAVADSNVIEVEVPAEATYVRFECWGRGERFAWTQPFFNVAD
jgi:hypothetical protein